MTEDYSNLIDLNDYAGRPERQRQPAFLSRALASRAAQGFTGISAEEAAKAVVDGFHDNGIDALAIDGVNRRLVLVQSKWDPSGDTGLSQGDALKVRSGCSDLFNMRFDRFSPALQARQAEISAA
ncbi:hypothetical protein [Streptomyces noursei]|uniref:hypothetical protein n=1 Tax=Streptomyces noursei TaxID=1971 RepID=UPI001F04B361|nr:hypothetical protein [Streptomyces noursei]